MRATARIEVARRDGRDVLVDARSEPPMAIRQTPDRVLIVGSAAAPVGGDALALDVAVGAGSRLVLGTVAATIVWPGAGGEWSSQAVSARVGEGGHLCWTPEPMVAVAGCRHRALTTLDLAAGATAWIVEEVSLGRTGEASGRVDVEWRVTRDGSPLVHHAERLGPGVPGWGSAVATGHHRHLVALVAVGVEVAGPDTTVVTPDACAARLPVAPDVTVVLATAITRPAALHAATRCGLVRRSAAGHPDPLTEAAADASRARRDAATSSGRRVTSAHVYS